MIEWRVGARLALGAAVPAPAPAGAPAGAAGARRAAVTLGIGGVGMGGVGIGGVGRFVGGSAPRSEMSRCTSGVGALLERDGFRGILFVVPVALGGGMDAHVTQPPPLTGRRRH